ncbi:MAG: hypothetical protein MK077_01840 [Phycisphaerales bacterium]|nr:hypothetical protein [Phycisphaerales bacterium]
MLITITTLGGAERLRWQVMEVPRVDVPFTSHLVVQAIAPDGALTGRSGSTLSDVGWHAFVWTPDGGTQPCLDTNWSLSQGDAINTAHTVAGRVSQCPPQDGACDSAPAMLSLDGQATLLGPLIPQVSMTAGITESGHVVFTQRYESSSDRGGWVVMPNGTTIELPLPATAWSLNLAAPKVVDELNQALVIAGYVWMTPNRQPMVWTVEPTGEVTSMLLPTPESNGEAHAVLTDGSILGLASIEGSKIPVRWTAPWETWTPLADAQADRTWKAATCGTTDGRTAGTVTIAGRQAVWVRETDGTIFTLDAAILGLSSADISVVAWLPDGSVLLDIFDLTTYATRSGTWHAETGFATVASRAFDSDPIEGLGTGSVIGAAIDGSLAINRYPDAWAAIAIAPGDANGDGTITVDDLLETIAQWGSCGVPCLGDLDADGHIGVDDLLIVLSAMSG